MKKVLSFFLAVIMLFSCLTAAFAADEKQYAKINTYSDIPLIEVRGDGGGIYDEDDNRVFYLRDILDIFKSSDDEDSTIKESVLNVLYPFLLQGVMFDNWDPYYKALEKEIGEMFEKAILDENGNPQYGTGISLQEKAMNETNMKTNKADANGRFKLSSSRYHWQYDWRLDPIYNAHELHKYIEEIKKTTGAKEVSITSNCLGTIIAATYVEEFGMDGIRGIAFDGGVENGAELMSEMISGKFKLDLNAVSRMLKDLEASGTDFGDNSNFIYATMDMLDKNGVFDTVKGVSKELIYYKLVKGVTSALALSTVYTFPCYWACVKSEDYETAKEYVFGKEGSEKRQKYAGLIEKIDNYDVKVRKNLDSIFKEIDENGNVAILSKYGFQVLPFCESLEALGDEVSTVTTSSLGATTSDIYTTLSDKYIAQRQAEGLGRYISPDKKVDASTCLLPDSTWFLKGCSHQKWPNEMKLFMATIATANEKLTVNDFEKSQFMVYSYEDGSIAKMTEDNCHTENWEADAKYDKPNSWAMFLVNFLRSLFRWFTALIKKFG